MTQALLIVLGIYFAACYAYGMYLAARLFTNRRLRQSARGAHPRRVIRPLHDALQGPEASPEWLSQHQLEQAA